MPDITNVDIILGSLAGLKKFQKYQTFPLAFWSEKWFPVWYNLKTLKKMGVNVRFLNFYNIKYKRLSKIVCVDSRLIENFFSVYPTMRLVINNVIVPFLKKLRNNVDFLVYFDNGDGTGHTHFEVLPFVDRYLKKQFLKDKSLYTKLYHKDRIYTDFYNKEYSIEKVPEKLPGFPLDLKYQDKLGLSWNFAYKDYRPYKNKLSQLLYGISRKYILKYHKPSSSRKLLFSANYTLMYDKTFSFHREQILNVLNENYKNNSNVSIGKVPKKEYLDNLGISKAIISPFGWGELCYRDFETFIGGAALIKPNVNHLETWPDLFKENETYIPFSWKIEDWKSSITEILLDEKNLLKVARKGQKSYNEIWTKQGNEAFCKRFIEMISFN